MSNPLFDTLFAKHAGSDRIFLIRPGLDDLTYAAFLEMCARFANVIAEAGLTEGDRLAIQVAKSAEALAVYGACVQSGVIFLPLNTAYTASEVAYFVKDSGAKLVLCDPAAADDLKPVADTNGAALMTLDAEGRGSFADAADTQPVNFVTAERKLDDLAAFLYTSGTTGRSKGAMLTQGNLLSNTETLHEIWRFSSDDILLHALPIFHTHGLFVATNLILNSAARMVFFPKFDADLMLDHMPDATVMMGVPTFYTRLLGSERLTQDQARSMRLFISGSAPLLSETHRQFKSRTGHAILERYGMTETNMNTSNPYAGERRPGTVGFPLPGVELKVTDPLTGQDLPGGQVGQIEVRGPNVFKGYWNMPEKTKEELRSDGFFITGDLGQIDEDGYVHIVGRNKDLIISGGYNIYPKEVEVVLDAQDGIAESAVIGVPHADFGEAVIGVVVPSGEDDPDIDAITSAIAGNLARFKQPKQLIVVDALPRNTMGKVQKNVLRDKYREAFS
ncbi:malonate--CoA ligase [Litoreibacter roseus]|uniref:Malonyl-CoA synthase n=1 Tax=Litoreibacter roseus TaxID=2601869 RepID=A0A6N6JBP6_9RHOB|nr:malonyl-CoA synthase [Litoreibacter roseus]GFE63417.1 malonyl-CoA synthase [Litoreibacter roseus]